MIKSRFNKQLIKKGQLTKYFVMDTIGTFSTYQASFEGYEKNSTFNKDKEKIKDTQNNLCKLENRLKNYMGNKNRIQNDDPQLAFLRSKYSQNDRATTRDSHLLFNKPELPVHYKTLDTNFYQNRRSENRHYDDFELEHKKG